MSIKLLVTKWLTIHKYLIQLQRVKALFYVLSFQSDLDEDLLKIRLEERTWKDKARLYSIRFAINILVLICLGGSAWLIIFLTQKSIEV